MLPKDVVVNELSFQIHGKTRDECIATADELAMQFLGILGGAPWVMLDDDWKRINPMPPTTLTDDQGFLYVGMRRYQFTGPLVGNLSISMHDGYKPQGGEQ